MSYVLHGCRVVIDKDALLTSGAVVLQPPRKSLLICCIFYTKVRVKNERKQKQKRIKLTRVIQISII